MYDMLTVTAVVRLSTCPIIFPFAVSNPKIKQGKNVVLDWHLVTAINLTFLPTKYGFANINVPSALVVIAPLPLIYLVKSVFNSDISTFIILINSNLSVIGNKYQTTSLLTTSIPATTETAVLQLTNLPKGTYIASGGCGGSNAMGTGGTIVIKASGNNTAFMTAIYNTGYTINGAITSIFEFTSDGNNTITLYLNVGQAKTITYGRLTAVRIA